MRVGHVPSLEASLVSKSSCAVVLGHEHSSTLSVSSYTRPVLSTCVTTWHLKGEPWNITPDQVREVTWKVKSLAPTILEEESGPGGGASNAGGGAWGWRQRTDKRFWEVDLPAFIERCLSSSITDDEALSPIHELFLVSPPPAMHRIMKQLSCSRGCVSPLETATDGRKVVRFSRGWEYACTLSATVAVSVDSREVSVRFPHPANPSPREYSTSLMNRRGGGGSRRRKCLRRRTSSGHGW